MWEIIEKHLLFLLGIILLLPGYFENSSVPIFLAGLIFTEFTIIFSSNKYHFVLLIVLGLCGIFLPALTAFVPVALYDVFREKWWPGTAILILVFTQVGQAILPWQILFFICSCGLSYMLASKTVRIQTIEANYKLLRDSSTEAELLMKEKNKELMEKQDYEIHLATLSERNRIAREIHDNVGHMLSRSILQMGALQTIYKDEPLHGQLVAVSDTLNEAMNNIRESVHDLHDESVDLKQSILDATKDIRETRQLALDYDMSAGVPRNVKYCIISIVKEAANNIIKHSDATKVTVILREHPGFYQVLVEDNGTTVANNPNPGIGLRNMADRVESLGGSINFSTNNGFKILISIKK